jgi:hypothetical protein
LQFIKRACELGGEDFRYTRAATGGPATDR